MGKVFMFMCHKLSMQPGAEANQGNTISIRAGHHVLIKCEKLLILYCNLLLPIFVIYFLIQIPFLITFIFSESSCKDNTKLFME